jgi:dTDP-4-amino-4,6-dideoxygalactose transaminase
VVFKKIWSKKVINVTKSYLPNIEKYKSYIDEIYKTAWLTNQGPLVQKLEKRLAQYLGVKNIVLVSNGTIALEIAYLNCLLTV